MATYVDDAEISWKGKVMYHMTADSLEELHEFAQKAGINKCWFDRKAKHKHPHYDINQYQRAMVVELGAVEVSRAEMVVLAKKLVARKPIQQTLIF